MLINLTKQFLKQEATAGVLLFIAALLAVMLDNSPFASVYTAVLSKDLSIHLGSLLLAKSLLHWINDGLMVLFFLTVGLELKREIVCGHLSEPSKVILPMIAAIGGMILPALIYYMLNRHDPILLKGWAIPVATDIAFALAVLSLLSKRVPLPLKLFLLAVTIFDDIGAIVIIAVFHTQALSWLALMAALCITVLLILLNVLRIQKITPYALLGVVLWICVLKSGVQATLAGIVLACTIPVNSNVANQPSPLEKLERRLVPWVSFLILPLFGFANSGISFTHVVPGAFSNTIVWGIVLGLFLGKQLGIFTVTWLCVRLRLCRLPQQVTWAQIYAVGILCGIGFTMSLFIGTLSFTGQAAELMVSVRFGVFVASIVSGICGYGVLYKLLVTEQPLS